MLCLLSFFIFGNRANGQAITCKVDREIGSESYGQVTISGLGEELAQFKTQTFSKNDWTQFYTVKVEGATRAMLGSYEATGSGLTFKPRFLPDPQVSYEVSFSSKGARKLLTNFSLEAESTWTIQFAGTHKTPAEIVGIFPQSEMLPANILRIYVAFSEPMSFENPHDFIQIVDEDGRLVTEPFVEIEEGLWNENRTRLTLLFHPGRIKRGVGPNMTQGEIFEVSREYTLKISSDWKAGSGNGLKLPFAKSFEITKAIRRVIEIEGWKVTAPTTSTNQQLVIQTDQLLDKALAERMISVIDSKGAFVDGRFEFNGYRTELIFYANSAWNAGIYQLSIDPKLEDVCGNTPVNVFDLEGSGQKKTDGNLSLAFTVD